MTMEFNKAARLAALAGNRAGGRSDWHGLRARLAAGYAARPVLAQGKTGANPAVGGSFDCGSARALAVYGRSRELGLGGINPTALGSGKSVRDNGAAVAGAQPAGD
jgi:hypothetical protein